MMGKVIMSGIVPQLVAPVTGILASELAVGSTVKLMENGVATEYLVVNQGKPSGSSLYDDSCDGLWLLRKDIYATQKWHSVAGANSYGDSDIHTYLNGTFFSVLGTIEKSAIKQVKIPYVNGYGNAGTVASGASGLPTKVFLLGGYEVGYTTSDNSYFPVDGGKLSYFVASTSGDSKRVAYLNGTATAWWLRSPVTFGGTDAWVINTAGGIINISGSIGNIRGVRPALVLPNSAVFDPETLILKGVA